MKKLILDEFELITDYSQSLEQMITIGKYDWKNVDINSKNFSFPTELIGKKVSSIAKIFNFSGEINTEQLKHQLERNGYFSGNLAELLILGEKNFGLRNFPIIVLHPSSRFSDGYRYYPYLDLSNKRKVGLYWGGYKWRETDYFLAVRKRIII